MRIAHINWGLTSGGIETMLVNIINEQVINNEVLLIIISNRCDKSLLDKISCKCHVVFCNRKKGSKNILPIIKLNAYLYKFHPDIVHLHAITIYKLLLYHHNVVLTIHHSKLQSRISSKIKAVFAISNSVKKDIDQTGYLKSIVIENGIKVENIKNKEYLSNNNDVFKFVQTGSLIKAIKGQDLIIKAANILYNQKKINNFSVHFIGEGIDKKELVDLSIKLGLTNIIFFEGSKSQSYIFNHLKEYDCLILASRHEGFGLVVAEGMAAKLPVLVSNIEGPMEIIDNGRCGLFFQSDDEKDLAKMMESILQKGYDKNKIEMAYDKVKEKYDIKKTSQKYLYYYKLVIDGQI